MPIVVGVIVVVIGLIYAVLAAPTEEDRAGAAYFDVRIARRLNAPPEPPISPSGPATRRTTSAVRTIRADPRTDRATAVQAEQHARDAYGRAELGRLVAVNQSGGSR